MYVQIILRTGNYLGQLFLWTFFELDIFALTLISFGINVEGSGFFPS